MNGSSDYIPEMAHGRISVRDADEALLVVEKIINYEKNPPTNPEFYTKGLHAGYFQDSTHDGVSDYRYAKTTIEMYDYMTARGFQSDLVLYTEPSVNPISFNAYFTSQTTLPSKYRRSNGYAWDGDKYDIISALNDGRLYAFHRDHGHYNEWVQPNVTVGDLNMLNNGNELPIVFSVNCGTGLFAKPEPAVCFAEKLQRHPNGGAVGIVAATAETVSGYNDAFIIGMMDAIWSNPGIIPDMGMGTDTATVIPHQPIYAMGDVMIQGLIRMTDTWDPVGWADKNHFHLYHYFGDPAMQVWTSAPVQLTALYDDELFIGSTSLHISGANCSDAIATICSGDEIWTKIRLQNGSGTIHFPAIDASVSYITLTISKHNYIPLEIYIPVTGYPEVEFTADQTEICPSDVVKFTDLTTNNPTFWHWMITPDFYEFVNSTNAYSQNPYIKFNSSGNYSISLTAVNGSGSQSLTKNGFINVFPTPEPPITHDRDKCFSDEIPTLSAEGSNVRWYADEQLTILLHEGNDYTPSQVLIGDNIYYVNQSVNGCVSDLASVSLTEYPPTPAPQVNDYTACETDTIFLIATGTYIKWYNDPNGEELLAEKDTLVLVSLPEGNYTYYASNTENSCESVLESVSLTVLPAAPVPLTNNYTICEYDTAICIAEGNHITWYSDPAGSEILKLGDTLIVCNLTPGEHIYYVGNAVNECYSVLVSSKVTVHAQPNLPISENVQACWGETVVLAADGENILWYSGIDEKSPIYSGNNLDLGQPEIGYYEYYLTQTVLNCESERLLVQLEVNNLPFFSLGGDTTINLGDTLEIQAPLSGQYLWFDGTTDSNLMFLSAEYGLGSNSCWLQITSNLECSYTDSINILVLNRPNRLPILDDKFTYILFPNPAESSVIIKLLQPDTIPAKVIVRDLQGRIHLRGSLDNTSNEIDLSQIPRGIYFITVITDKFDRTLRLILE
jgi:PKD repeat protein